RGRTSVDDRERTPLTVVVQEVEELVLLDGATHASAKLLPLVVGLRGSLTGLQRGCLAIRIKGVQRWIAQVIEQVPMHVVRAGFRDGVDLPSSSIAKLCAVGAGANVELLHCVQAIGV